MTNNKPPVEQKVPESFCGKSYAQVESVVAPRSGGQASDGSTMFPLHMGSTTRKRPTPLAVRFSAVELEIVKTKAKTAGCTTNSYVRAAALGSDYKPPRDPELTQAIIKLNWELTCQGRNLNQIAKRINGEGATPEQGDSLLAMIARALFRTLRDVRAALSKREEYDADK